jgi:ArsR family transcriptional regulator
MNTTATAVLDLIEAETARGCCAPEATPTLRPETAQDLSDTLQLLAHPIRLQILDILAQHGGDVCVCDLEGALPVKQPTVSHHLRLLREAGVIDCERRGLWAYYFLKRDVFQARWAAMRAYFERLT